MQVKNRLINLISKLVFQINLKEYPKSYKITNNYLFPKGEIRNPNSATVFRNAPEMVKVVTRGKIMFARCPIFCLPQQ